MPAPTSTPLDARLAARRRAVHAACRQLGMDEATRRAMLRNVAGVDSTTALTLPGAARVLDHLAKLGARRTPAVKPPGHHAGEPVSAPAGGEAQLAKVKALLTDMRLPWAYAVACLRRISRGQGNTIERFEWATPEMLHGVIVALTIEQSKRRLREQSVAHQVACGDARYRGAGM